jgi:hypothetical protein
MLLMFQWQSSVVTNVAMLVLVSMGLHRKDGGEQPVTPESVDGTDTLERGPKTPRLESPAQQTMNLVTSTDLIL